VSLRGAPNVASSRPTGSAVPITDGRSDVRQEAAHLLMNATSSATSRGASGGTARGACVAPLDEHVRIVVELRRRSSG